MRSPHPTSLLALSLGAALAAGGQASAQLNVGTGFLPDAAYNPAIDRYLVAWGEPLGWEDAEVYGRLIRPNGTFETGRRLIAPEGTTSTSAGDQRVASVRAAKSAFVVVCLARSFTLQPMLNAVDAQGRTGSSVIIPGTFGEYYSVDVGGDDFGDDVIVVAHEGGSNERIRAFEVDADTQVTLQTIDVASGGDLGFVAISSTGGQPGRYLVTWTAGGFTGNGNIMGAIVDRDLQLLVSEFPIAATASQEQLPAVDGDGTSWVVAYERAEAGSMFDHDVVCRRVTYDPRSGSVYVSSAAVIEGDPGVDEGEPSVRWLGESYVIGFAEEPPGFDDDVYAKSVEFLGCQPCEGEFAVATTGASENRMRIAAGPGRDAGVLVWQSGNAILGSLFFTDDGEVVDLGGGCGEGGTATATCAAVGAPAFGMRVQHAAPSASGWLVLGATAISFPCGPCTLVPDPVATLAASTDARGNAEVSFQLGSNANLRGLSLKAQWLLVAPGGCSSVGLAFSNAIDVTIE